MFPGLSERKKIKKCFILLLCDPIPKKWYPSRSSIWLIKSQERMFPSSSESNGGRRKV
jgi:hypothetical protein